MSYMLIEIRGISLPLLTKLINKPDQDFLDNLDNDYEILVRCNETSIEQYVSGKWVIIPEA